MNAQKLWAYLTDAVTKFNDHSCMQHAAALAYYTVFSIGPMLVLIVALVGLVWDPSDFREAMHGQLGGLLGAAAAGQIQEILINMDQNEHDGWVASIVSPLVLLVGATTAFAQLQASLNTIWSVQPGDNVGIIDFAMKRLLSLGMVLVMGFLMVVSLGISAIFSAVDIRLAILFPEISTQLLQIVSNTSSLLLIAALFGCIFRVLPEAEIRWRDVVVGALVTTGLFALGKWGIGVYLGNSDIGSVYGAAGSMAVLLVWVYYSAAILLFGAELTAGWAERFGGGITPEEGAVKIHTEHTYETAS